MSAKLADGPVERARYGGALVRATAQDLAVVVFIVLALVSSILTIVRHGDLVSTIPSQWTLPAARR